MIPVVAADHVTKRFGAITAVDDLSLSVGDGEILALLGPNGAGKSTLIRMIVALIKPDQPKSAASQLGKSFHWGPPSQARFC